MKKKGLKKVRLAIGTPTGGYCRVEFCESIMELQKSLLRDKRFNVEDVCILFYCSSVIPENRHKIVQMARQWKATHLLFVDDDMRFYPQAGLSLLNTMLRSDIKILGANCIKREYPIQYMATGFDDKELISYGKEGLEQAKYTGNSFVLMDMEVFDKVSLPYYAFPWNQTTEKFGTEDSFFMIKAMQEAGIPTIVDHDVSMLIQHVGPHVFDPLKPRVLDPNLDIPENLKAEREKIKQAEKLAAETLGENSPD